MKGTAKSSEIDDGRRTSNSRRTVLAVPASNLKMIEKAKRLQVDEIFLDLEDSVAPQMKEIARENAANAISAEKFTTSLLAVRINQWATSWAFSDVEQIVSTAGHNLNSIILPKVESAAEVKNLDALLEEFENKSGLVVGQIGIQIQIESAKGVANIWSIASASARAVSLIFGPGDFAASIGMQTLSIGEDPIGYSGGDAYHYVLMQILIAARANDLMAIDGPFGAIQNQEGLKRKARNSALLGYDGKWVIHPDQISIVNSIFTPDQQVYDEAEELIEKFSRQTSNTGEAQGAMMHNGNMIDEASRKMALIISARGRAAGLSRSSTFDSVKGK